jgi:hypothetical protein
VTLAVFVSVISWLAYGRGLFHYIFVYDKSFYESLIKDDGLERDILLWYNQTFPSGLVDMTSDRFSYSSAPGNVAYNEDPHLDFLPWRGLGMRVGLFTEESGRIFGVFIGHSSRLGIVLPIDDDMDTLPVAWSVKVRNGSLGVFDPVGSYRAEAQTGGQDLTVDAESQTRRQDSTIDNGDEVEAQPAPNTPSSGLNDAPTPPTPRS